MAWFTKKEWLARLAEFAGRRTLTNVSTGEATTYDVARNEGTISQEGTAFSPDNMNDLEQRLYEAFAAAEDANTELNKKMGGVSSFVVDDSTGKITGYTTEIGGADTVFPFSGDYTITFTMKCTAYNGSGTKLSETTGEYHMYIRDGEVTTDYEQMGYYRASAIAGWTYVTLTSISISQD